MGWSFFSPYEDCEAALITRINAATELLAASLTMYQSDPIHNAILAAQARFGLVYIIFDRRQQFLADPRLIELQDAGVIVLLDKHERSCRSQYILIDQYWLLTGTYLYTYTFNDIYASNLMTLAYNAEYMDFMDDFVYHLDHSELLT